MLFWVFLLPLPKPLLRAKKIPSIIILQNFLRNSTANLLPLPLMNVVNGGSHADSGLEIQEFMICPTGTNSFAEGLRMGSEIFIASKTALHVDTSQQWEMKAVCSSSSKWRGNYDAPRSHWNGRTHGKSKYCYGCHNIRIFFKNGIYIWREKTSNEMVSYYQKLVETYPSIISIEDGFAEDDWMVCKNFKKTLEIVFNWLETMFL